MTRRYLKWTRRGGETVNLTIWDAGTLPSDYSVVDGFANQNSTRHALSILEGVKMNRFSVLPYLSDMMIVSDPYTGGYKMWCYTRNWPGRASFLAGILVGQRYKWKKIQRRRRKRQKIR
jgi:hypothetical protein